MIEESGLTPMTMEYACLEAGRYGVFLSLLEKKIASVLLGRSRFTIKEPSKMMTIGYTCIRYR